MEDVPERNQSARRRKIALVGFLILAAFMYVTITYKITHFGP